MKKRLSGIKRLGFLLVPCSLALLTSFSTPALCMMVSHMDGKSMRGKKSYHAVNLQEPISFVTWDGNKLITTAGSFLISDSVQVIDMAGSRYLQRDFKGNMPSVKFFFKHRKLIKVIIK